MEVKDVVKMAIDHVSVLFSEETPTNIGLEEVTFDEATKRWKVTVGFSRPWDYQTLNLISGLQPKQPFRQFKVVEIGDMDSKVKAITIRE